MSKFPQGSGSGPRCAKNKTKQLGPSVGDKHFSQQLSAFFHHVYKHFSKYSRKVEHGSCQEVYPEKAT